MPPDSDVYFHVPGVARVSWDRTFRLVHVEWEGWANSAEFAALLDAEVRVLREHGGYRPHWVIQITPLLRNQHVYQINGAHRCR
jgi:hypothetical protein